MKGSKVETISVESNCSGNESDHISVIGAELTDDRLLLQVRHGGGCAQHSYLLCPDPAVLDTEPSKQRLVVIHDAHGDECRAESTLTLSAARAELPSLSALEAVEDSWVWIEN